MKCNESKRNLSCSCWFFEMEFRSRVSEIYETVTKSKISKHVRTLVLDVMGNDLEGNDIDDLPYLKYTFRQTN